MNFLYSVVSWLAKALNIKAIGTNFAGIGGFFNFVKEDFRHEGNEGRD